MTDYQVEKIWQHRRIRETLYSLVRIKLQTGRTHQVSYHEVTSVHAHSRFGFIFPIVLILSLETQYTGSQIPNLKTMYEMTSFLSYPTTYLILWALSRGEGVVVYSSYNETEMQLSRRFSGPFLSHNSRFGRYVWCFGSRLRLIEKMKLTIMTFYVEKDAQWDELFERTLLNSEGKGKVSQVSECESESSD